MRAAVTVAVLALGALGAPLASAQEASRADALAPVQALYATADYEGALSALGRIPETTVDSESAEVDRYRVLCLVALGRTAEADSVIEALLVRSPLYELTGDAPPRIRAMFDETRARVLPDLIRQQYAEGKAAFDRKDFGEALRAFEQTLRVLDAIGEDEAAEPELADLRTLADGFLTLSRASHRAEPAAPSPAAASAADGQPASPAPATGERRPSDPIVIRQDLPVWTPPVTNNVLFEGEFRGAIEIEINEQGNVSFAAIAVPVHPIYDALLLRAARDWKYQPAHLDGRPVRVRKRIDVVLQSR